MHPTQITSLGKSGTPHSVEATGPKYKQQDPNPAREYKQWKAYQERIKKKKASPRRLCMLWLLDTISATLPKEDTFTYSPRRMLQPHVDLPLPCVAEKCHELQLRFTEFFNIHNKRLLETNKHSKALNSAYIVSAAPSSHRAPPVAWKNKPLHSILLPFQKSQKIQESIYKIPQSFGATKLHRKHLKT